MSTNRARAWADSRQQEKDIDNELIEDAAISVDVFRPGQATGSKPGLDSEVGEPALIRTQTVRLDPTTRGQRETIDEPVELIALSQSDDDRRADLWRYHDLEGRERWLKVVYVEPTEGGSDVWLATTRKGEWRGR